MSRTAIIVVGLLGICTEVHGLWLMRKIAARLTNPMRIVLWIKRVSVLSLLVSGTLSLVAAHFETSLSVVFLASFAAWVVSTMGFFLVLGIARTKRLSRAA
jgi:hypothetical protein